MGRMWKQGRPITGRGDYILGMDRRDFYNVCIRESRLLVGHQMILAEIKWDGVSIIHKYYKGRTTWPIVAPKGETMWEEDVIFNNLRKEVKKPMGTEW